MICDTYMGHPIPPVEIENEGINGGTVKPISMNDYRKYQYSHKNGEGGSMKYGDFQKPTVEFKGLNEKGLPEGGGKNDGEQYKRTVINNGKGEKMKTIKFKKGDDAKMQQDFIELAQKGDLDLQIEIRYHHNMDGEHTLNGTINVNVDGKIEGE